MKTKTATLTGPALDWAVAKAEGAMYRLEKPPERESWEPAKDFNRRYSEWKGDGFGMDTSTYSTNWSQGGPIIDREKIGTDFIVHRGETWRATSKGLRDRGQAKYHDGPTPLIAAMRCYVAAKLGDEVDVPDELV